MKPSKHVWRNIEFAHFINLVMWHRANARVWAGPMGLCFSWQGASGQTFAAFQTGKHVTVYRAGSGFWPAPMFGDLCTTRRDRQVAMQIGIHGGHLRNDDDYYERRYQDYVERSHYQAGYGYACGYHD